MLIGKIKENNLYRFLKLYNNNEYNNENINQLNSVLNKLKDKKELDIVLFNKKNLSNINEHDIENFLKLFFDLNDIFTYDIGKKFLDLLEKEKIIGYEKLDKIEYKGFVLHFFKLHLKKDRKNEEIQNN